jgi:hypothetical protein
VVRSSHVLTFQRPNMGLTAYYRMMEKSIPTDKNCSFITSPMTDFLAFVWGAIVIGYGYTYDNEILTGLGASVIVEHIWQLTRKVN